MKVNDTFVSDPIFREHSRKKAVRRTEKYRNYVSEIGDPSTLRSFLQTMALDDFEIFPKILCHGDPHRWNILKRPDSSCVFIDMEFAAYTEPTFDITRCLVSEHPDNMEILLGTYLHHINETSLVDQGESTLVRAILIDTVSQDISRIVSFKKKGVDDAVTYKQIKRIKQLMENIFDSRL